jgi:4'-phosphopantetheinyl transferase
MTRIDTQIFAYDISKLSVQFSELSETISEAEIKKSKKFKNKNDTRLFLGGKMLSRKVISSITGVDPRRLIFKSDRFGRPFLVFPKMENFDFNLSHSCKLVILAIGNGKIGVDIEKIVPIDLDISENCFHKKEIEFIHSDKNKKLDNFYKLWTLKESFIKLTGKGLSYPIKNIHFEFKNNCINLYQGSKKIEKKFKMYDVDKSYKMALCLEKNEKFPFNIIYL